MLRRQTVPDVFVDRNLKALLALVVGCEHVVFGYILHTEVTVRCRVVVFGRIDQAGFH